MVNSIENSIKKTVDSIKGKSEYLDKEASRIAVLDKLRFTGTLDPDSWCVSVLGSALKKLHTFTERNFNYVESMGLVSVARYVFELSVWLRLFECDSRYGLVYYHNLLNDQCKYWKDYKSQIEREINLLNSFDVKESTLFKAEMERIKQIKDSELQEVEAFNLGNKVIKIIDGEASRKFSVYTEQAKTFGYGYQAVLLENRLLPKIKKSIADVDNEINIFDSKVSDDIRDLIPKKWNWRSMAQKIDMVDEYDYIYTFSSKLLHASPVSITTNQQSLELSEMLVFLKFIDVKMNDALEISKKH